MKRFAQGFVIAFLMIVLIGGVSGCKKEGPAEKAGKQIDKAMEKAGDQLEKAGEKMKDAVKK